MFGSYLGTMLMTPDRRRAIWAIYGDVSTFKTYSISMYISMLNWGHTKENYILVRHGIL